MIVIQNKEHFRRVVQFAKRHGLIPKLRDTLRWLANYANGEGCTYDKSQGRNTRCILYPDFAPNSFAFRMDGMDEKGNWSYWFNGGVIYQGPDSPADGSSPSMTVSLGNSKDIRWGVHT